MSEFSVNNQRNNIKKLMTLKLRQKYKLRYSLNILILKLNPGSNIIFIVTIYKYIKLVAVLVNKI